MNFSDHSSSHSWRGEEREESQGTTSTLSAKHFSATNPVGSNASGVHGRHDEIIFYDFLGVDRIREEPIRSGSKNLMVDGDGYQEPESMLPEYRPKINKLKVGGHASIVFHDFLGVNRTREELVGPGSKNLTADGDGNQESESTLTEDLPKMKMKKRKVDGHAGIVFHDFLGVNRTREEPIRSRSKNLVMDLDGYQDPQLFEDMPKMKKGKVDGHARIVFPDFLGVNRTGKESACPGLDSLMVDVGVGFQEQNLIAPRRAMEDQDQPSQRPSVQTLAECITGATAYNHLIGRRPR